MTIRRSFIDFTPNLEKFSGYTELARGFLLDPEGELVVTNFPPNQVDYFSSRLGCIEGAYPEDSTIGEDGSVTFTRRES